MTLPRPSAISLALLPALLCLPDGVAAQQGDVIANTTIPLSYRAARKWTFSLPAHKWNRIGTSLEIGGRKFKVATEGTALLVDTDGAPRFLRTGP